MKRLPTNQGETLTDRESARASLQLEIVREIMQDGAWLNLTTIVNLANALHLQRTGKESRWGESAISARLRDLRKAIGGKEPLQVDRRRDPAGWYEYRASPIDTAAPSQN